MKQPEIDKRLPKDELDRLLQFQFSTIKTCTIQTETGEVLLSTKPESRYPYFYPRDSACATELLAFLSISEFSIADTAFELLKAIAHFVLKVIRIDGYLGQRYALTGEDKGIYRQEDNVAHGIIILSRYLLTARKKGAEIQNMNNFLSAINSAAHYALTNYYHTEINLFHSTTSIHESAIEEGFTCWTNFAYLKAFTLASVVNDEVDIPDLIPQKILRFKSAFKHNLLRIMIANNRFLRRIDQKGNYDFKPDFTLLSPFYFGFGNETKCYLDLSVTFLERQLWDPELGMIQRYLPFSQDSEIHIHAGNGPWLQYTAILAQYHYWNKNFQSGDELMRLIDTYKNEQGEIPEHISTCGRFDAFMTSDWKSGNDFLKEFDKHILLNNLDFDKILEEANNMQRAYREVYNKCLITNAASEDIGYIRFVTPLMWSHIEYMKALLYKHSSYMNKNL